MPTAPRSSIRVVSTLAGVLLLLGAAAGCGGSSPDARATSSASPGPVEVPKTWPPKGSDGELATYPYKYGVSWQAPRDWALEITDDNDDDNYLWKKGPKGKGGLVFVTMQNSRSTVPEWKAIVVSGYKGLTKTLDEPVDVPGYGKGAHLQWKDPKRGTTTDILVITSIDGVLMEMTVSTPKAGDPALAEQLISSVKRTT